MPPKRKLSRDEKGIVSSKPSMKAVFLYESLMDEADMSLIQGVMSYTPCTTRPSETHLGRLGVYFDSHTTSCKLVKKLQNLEFFEEHVRPLSAAHTYFAYRRYPTEITEDKDGTRWAKGFLMHHFDDPERSAQPTSSRPPKQARITECALKLGGEPGSTVYTVRNRDGATIRHREASHGLTVIGDPEQFAIHMWRAPTEAELASCSDLPDDYMQVIEDWVTSFSGSSVPFERPANDDETTLE